MNCTIKYGFGRDHYTLKTMPVAEAFRLIPSLIGFAFINIYYNNKIVYTTQGMAGYCFICDNCPYVQ